MIDVGALGPYALEAGVYSERVRAYSARVAGAPAAPRPPARLLKDVAAAECTALLNAPPLTPEHRDFVSIF